MRNLFTFLFCLQLSLISLSQGKTLAVQQINNIKEIPTAEFPTPDLNLIHAQDIERDNNGELYRIGVCIESNINPINFGKQTINDDGSSNWEIRIKSEGAEAISFLFSKFVLYGESVLTIRNTDGHLVHAPLTSRDVINHHMQNAALCFGDDLILNLYEPTNTQASELFMDRIVYNYRATGNPNAQKINESDACEVNVNCTPVGDSWQDEKDGVARIYVVEGGMAGWCTGSLVNNTAQNCKPYFLTALHCGLNSTTSNMNQWRFYFRYESPNCTNPSTAGTLDDHYITGCFRISDSNDGGGSSGSDFLLVQLGAASNESNTISTLKSANFGAYWNGWNANTSSTNGGAGIHHPAGDIKKISTFNGNTSSTSWGSAGGSHWQLSWSSNANGHGVTEGGSSGSPLFNNSGQIIGTLTGGSSYCNTPTSPDAYGKMSYHWASNGTPNDERLKPWLDPINSSVLTLSGSADPCSAPTAPTTDFVASATNVTPGSTVTFTDITTGVPDNWSWSIAPGTGWAFAGGTNASSQNPQVTFNTIGQYTISLTASNSLGSDSETKTNYIIVEEASTPCEAGSAACDEYIANVLLNTIDNTSQCSTSGYGNYLTISTTLDIGSTYTATITPAVGTTIGQAYLDDEIAIWIDYNDDLDFDDAGEQVGYVLVANGWSNEFTFTIPASAAIGQVAMRARISYQPDGDIVPCGESTYGEVEDYSINIATVNVELTNGNNLDAVKIYPNPSNDFIHVDLSDLIVDIHELVVMDITGKIIETVAVEKNSLLEINLDNYANGVYHLRIGTGANSIVKQFVKE